MRRFRSDPWSVAKALVLMSCLLTAVVPAAAQGRGDLKAGADVYAGECAECHSVRPNKNKKGPSLFAVMGRRAGEEPGAKYSEAMRQSQWIWDAATLRRYIAAPKGALPGGTMKYEGLNDPKAMEDLIAYLATLK